MQKVLPRFHGSLKQIAAPLDVLGSWCYSGPGNDLIPNFDPENETLANPALPISFDKIKRMKRRVRSNHFVSYAE
jgi:hypothetical protein